MKRTGRPDGAARHGIQEVCRLTLSHLSLLVFVQVEGVVQFGLATGNYFSLASCSKGRLDTEGPPRTLPDRDSVGRIRDGEAPQVRKDDPGVWLFPSGSSATRRQGAR